MNNKKPISQKIETLALNENWQNVYDFSKKFISSFGISKKDIVNILLSIEEIFVNIANYAYPEKTGKVSIKIEYIDFPEEFIITFEDYGIPFDPTKNKNPTINSSPQERKIGGMGIYMVKNLMNSMYYEYSNKKNHLKINKKIT